MAVERLAIFALSVSFTTSLILYPDLPPDIPPRAGRDGPFVGAPFVAFFLPTAAMALGWVLGALNRAPRSVPSGVVRAGAVTTFFLCAFHLIMLAAFIGEHPWLVRVLGALVGIFLIVTGNDLPRSRPTMVWVVGRLGTFDDSDPAHVWRWRRVVGYVRVAMGLALFSAALIGVPGFWRLIILAAGLEGVLRVAAGVSARRVRHAVASVIVISLAAGGGIAKAQEITRERIDTLPALIDAKVPELMEAGHVPGTAVAVVHQGRVVLLRGYGHSQLEPERRVDPTQTTFRVGSVTKTLTALAALQMVEAGRLDLHQDIRQYLPDVPLRYGATMHQLLTHTAGIDERFAGAYTDRAEHLEPLLDHLRRHPPEQHSPPGGFYSYSGYHYGLAGAVIERLSGVRYERYMADQVFRPLGMDATTAYQPPPTTNLDRARGYAWREGRQVALPFRFTYTSPSGGLTTTAEDMARVMLALVGDGSVDGRRVLLDASVKTLLAPQYTPDPRIPATAYGMTHWVTHGQRLLHKDGTLGDQIGVLVLAPASRLGIFAASNALPGVANQLLTPLLTHLFGPETGAAPPTPMSVPSGNSNRVAGIYRDFHHTRNDMSRSISLMLQSRISAEPDGAIRWRSRRWVEVAPLVFTSADGRDTIVFREDASGKIATLHAWGGTYERLGWAEQALFHAAFLAACVVAFLAYPLSQGVARRRRRPISVEGRAARRCAIVVAVANLAFIVWLGVSLRGLGASVPLSPVTIIWLSVPLASAALTALLPGFAAVASWEGWWTLRERVSYSAFAVVSVAFMVLLNYWKVLGIRY